MAQNNKRKKFQKRPWVPGTRPESRHQQAAAFEALREKLEETVGQPATEAQVNLNTVIWEFCQLFELSDSQIADVLGAEGVEAIASKIRNAVWH